MQKNHRQTKLLLRAIASIALVLLLGLAAWWLAELAQRRPDEHPSDAAPHADAPASVEPETTVATTAAKG